MLVNICAGSAYANSNNDNDYDLIYNEKFKQLVVSGVTSEQQNITNPYVTATVFSNDRLVALNQSVINADGSYKCTLGFKEGIPEDAVVRILVGDNEAEAVNPDITMIYNQLIDVKFETEDNGEYRTYLINLTELYKQTNQFDVIIAKYDNDGKLLETQKHSDQDVTFNNGRYYLEQKVTISNGYEKVFVWASLESPVPYAVTEEGFALDICNVSNSFGTKDNVLKDKGYYTETLDGNSNYEVYQKAVNEIPDEFEIIDAATIGAAHEIYVSQTGSDNADGTFRHPYKTLARAIKAYNQRPDIMKKYWTTIYLREGTYNIEKCMEINESAAYNDSAKLNIAAYNKEKVNIVAANTVRGDKFKLVTNENTSEEIYNSIHDGAEGNLYYCDYEDIGIDGFSGFDNNKLSVPVMTYNNETMPISRFPNTYNDRIEKVKDKGVDSAGKIKERFSIVPADKTPFTWRDTGKICMWSQMSVTWADADCIINIDKSSGTITGPADKVISQVGSYAYPVAVSPTNSGVTPSTIYFYNVFEEIDTEGEWCCDETEKRVYFYAKDGQPTANDIFTFSTNAVDTFLNIKNVSEVVIDGISFAQSDGAVVLSNCSNAIIQNCSFDNLTGIAVELSNCKRSGVLKSDFSNVNAAVSISTAQSKWNELSADRNFVQNCHCTESGSFVGIMNSNGNIISHNLAENINLSMVGLWHGCENIIEYNEARCANLVGNEGGVIYINGHADSMYNHIRYNYIHENRPKGTSFQLGAGISLDDMEGNTYIYGNIFENQYIGIAYNCGDNNICDGNVFINCTYGVLASTGMYGQYGSFMAHTNKTSEKQLKDIRLFPYVYSENLKSSDPWQNRYPKLFSYVSYMEQLLTNWIETEDYDSTDDMRFLRASTGNYFVNNIFAGFKHDNDIVMGQTSIGNNTYEENTFVDTTNPADSVQKYNGNDYSVIYANTTLSSYDATDADRFEKIGITYDEIVQSDTLRIIYATDSEIINNNEYVDLLWNKVKGANYYKITIAYDPDFTSIYSTDYTFNNYFHKKVSKSSFLNIRYYYKTEAYSTRKTASDIIAAAEGSAQFDDNYAQTEDKIILSAKLSTGSKWWVIRRYIDIGRDDYLYRNIDYRNENGRDQDNYTITKLSDENEEYLRFEGSNYLSKRNSITDDVSIGRDVENINMPIDKNTYITAEADVRYPDKASFPEINEALSSYFKVSNLASDKEHGSYGTSVGFTVKENSDGTYTLYAVCHDSILRTEKNMTLSALKSFTEKDLFGSWIHLSLKADMETGDILFDVNNGEATAILNRAKITTDSCYRWNIANCLVSMDFVGFSENSQKHTKLDIKNIEIKRTLK